MRTILGKLFFLIVSSSWLLGYHFSMEVDNTHPLLGEKTILSLHFSYENLEDYELDEPQFEHFSIKPIEDKEYQDDKGMWHVLLRYELVAQKVGTFALPPLTAHIEKIKVQYQKMYNRNRYLEKLTIQTKPLTLYIKSLPQGLKVTGTYTLTTEVDKQKVKAGEPVHFTVHLKGEGNIVDLSFFTLHIPDTIVYETSTSSNNKEFDIVSDHNYTIPALSLQYYNQSTQSIELLSSQAFGIEVITAPTPQKSKSKVLLILLLIFAGLLYYIYRLFSSLAYLDKKAMFIKSLKKCKTKEELLAKVAPYLGKDRELDRLIFGVEGVEDAGFIGIRRKVVKHFIHL